MYDEKPRILRPAFPAGKRVIVISDIHANLPYFKALLEKIRFSADDILILDGDFLEKGPDSLGTLRFVMELTKQGNVWPVLGNCDEWPLIFLRHPEGNEHMKRYFRRRRYGFLYEMLLALGIDPLAVERPSEVLPVVEKAFPEEWAFLRALPHAIETEHFIFVHAGMNGALPLEENHFRELTTRDAFLQEGQKFDKWIVTGHWPVVLYGEGIVCANPIICEQQHIICLDGGCVLKDDGQLNALILPDISCADADKFTSVYYDPFPTAEVLESQAAGERFWYIRWGDNEVQVLSRGEEFSRCRHLRTGYEMDILTKYLYSPEAITTCNDCTDYLLPLEKGDTVSIIETTSRGYFVKHNGVSGWYCGKLKGEGNAR